MEFPPVDLGSLVETWAAFGISVVYFTVVYAAQREHIIKSWNFRMEPINIMLGNF